MDERIIIRGVAQIDRPAAVGNLGTLTLSAPLPAGDVPFVFVLNRRLTRRRQGRRRKTLDSRPERGQDND